jgi:hypothetical protein
MSRTIQSAFLLSFLSSLYLCGESFAVDPELKTPYKLQVVLHFGDGRQLTEVFKDRVERDLRDGLQASFGDLVQVEVVRNHERLKEAMDAHLKWSDAWRERSDVKTHFVLIDCNGEEYVIQARQHDGLTGTAGPLVRRGATRDRDLVAREAALLVEQDFGLVGSFDAWPAKASAGEDKPVEVKLKGGGLGVALDHWIKKGDVFAVVQVAPGDKSPGQPVLGALLVVDKPPADGASTTMGRVFRRYPAPHDNGAGYRCVRLGAIQAPARLRLLQFLSTGAPGPLQVALKVQLRHNGFDHEEKTKIDKNPEPSRPDVDSARDSDGVFDRVTFVSVSSGDRPAALVPLAMLEDRRIDLPINVESGSKADFANDRDAWERSVVAAWLVHKEMFAEINALTAKPGKRAEAMKMLQDALDRSRDDHRRLSGERDELLKAAEKAKLPKPNLEDSEKLLKKLQEDEGELRAFLTDLEKIDKEENSPERKKWREQIEAARRMEKELEIDQALALYDQIPKEHRTPGLEEHVAELRKSWETDDEKLKAARRFVFKEWPGLDNEGVKAKLAEAQSAAKACKDAGDLRTLSKLFKATEAHAERMTQELPGLKIKIDPDDEARARLIGEVSPKLKDLALAINAYLESRAKK